MSRASRSINYLQTAHRNIAWFNDRYQHGELEMSPPFQRNPVWTNPQKAYLIDTILRGLPVPELYMQDLVDEEGDQQYLIVDGQQRIRACLEFLEGAFTLDDRESSEWGAVAFDELPASDKKQFFSYQFVVRTLPELPDPEIRDIFKRLNRNVVALNKQELRHATYWGEFISTVEAEAEENDFWADSGIFTARAFRRMLDVEFVSELAVAYLHGPQDKKKKLDHYYQIYEEQFEAKDEIRRVFRVTTGEIGALLENLRKTRFRKKSDFYTLFLVMAARHEAFPLARDQRSSLREVLLTFQEQVDEFLRIDSQEEEEGFEPRVVKYGKAVGRAASDIQSRRVRHEVLEELVQKQFTPAQQR